MEIALSENETRPFFCNWLGLPAFINDKYQTNKEFGHPDSPIGLLTEVVAPIKDKLWENIQSLPE